MRGATSAVGTLRRICATDSPRVRQSVSLGSQSVNQAMQHRPQAQAPVLIAARAHRYVLTIPPLHCCLQWVVKQQEVEKLCAAPKLTKSVPESTRHDEQGACAGLVVYAVRRPAV